MLLLPLLRLAPVEVTHTTRGTQDAPHDGDTTPKADEMRQTKACYSLPALSQLYIDNWIVFMLLCICHRPLTSPPPVDTADNDCPDAVRTQRQAEGKDQPGQAVSHPQTA